MREHGSAGKRRRGIWALKRRFPDDIPRTKVRISTQNIRLRDVRRPSRSWLGRSSPDTLLLTRKHNSSLPAHPSLNIHTFRFSNPLKKSKLLLSLCSSHFLPVALSSHPSSSATNNPQSLVIPLILALAPASVSSVTI